MTRLPPRLRELLSLPRVQTLLPLVVYALFAAVWIGRGVVAHPTTEVLGNADRDKTLIIWGFLWWPHAIVHGHDPFVANVVWAPHGVDLAWVTTAPVLGLVLAPVTATFGAIFSYNLAALAAAPLAAWTMFLLARRLTQNAGASAVAGFLFGFSPYVIGQSINHLHLAFVCLVPLAGWLAVRFFDGDFGSRRYTVLLALVLVLQFGISNEIFATATVFGAVALVLAWFLLDARPRLVALARHTALAYVATGVVVSPYLYHAFRSSTAYVRPNANAHVLDIANVLVPTRATWLRPPGSQAVAHHFTSSIVELGGYLGVPLLLIVLLAIVMLKGERVRRRMWLLFIAAVVAEVLALGPVIRVAGHKIAPGVWRLVQHLPAIGEAMSVRLAMYGVLFLALIVALWLAQPGRRMWELVLAGVAVVSFFPTPSGAFWSSHILQPRFFATPVYKKYIRPGDTALMFPYTPRDSWSMYWQAETGFRFKLIGGHTGQVVIPFECPWAGYYESFAGGVPPGGAAGFRRFLLAHSVDVIVEAKGTEPWGKTLVAAALPDVKPVVVGNATVYRLRSGLPLALPAGGPRLPNVGPPDMSAARAECRGHY
jgi:hypothetical protein